MCDRHVVWGLWKLIGWQRDRHDSLIKSKIIPRQARTTSATSVFNAILRGVNNKPEILFICPLPPPVHGSSMVSQSIKNSRMLNEVFEMDFVNLSTSRKVEEIGKRSLWLYVRKAVRFIGGYLFLQQEVSVTQVIMNFMGLGWAFSLPNNGHLWFVTMIILCYLMYIITSRYGCIDHARYRVEYQQEK